MNISSHNEPSKDNRVITALEDPNYTWRTSQGVSQAINLSLSEVQGIISKLEQDGLVIQSRIPDIRGRPLYKVNPTRILIKQLSETPSDDIQQKIGALADRFTPQKEDALLQERQSFKATLIAATFGFIFLLCSIAVLLIEHLQSAAIVSAISGAIAGVISGLFLALHNQTSKQLAHYSRQLERLDYFLLADSICRTLSDDNIQKARLDIISKIATFGTGQTDEKR
jgi:predicted transcriptional regulator